MNKPYHEILKEQLELAQKEGDHKKVGNVVYQLTHYNKVVQFLSAHPSLPLPLWYEEGSGQWRWLARKEIRSLLRKRVKQVTKKRRSQ
jgi:hypothetical protein